MQWEKIKDFLPGRKQHVGRTAADNRLFVNGVLWVLRSGARWHDLPERYGKYKSVQKRFVRWANSGVWERIFHELVRDKKSQYLMLDSTIVRAHQQPGGQVNDCTQAIALLGQHKAEAVLADKGYDSDASQGTLKPWEPKP